MAWQADLRNVAQSEPTGGLLVEALMRSKERPVERLRDDGGVFAYRTSKSVLVARAYIYGNIVSCHKKALTIAANNKLPLRMYIADSKRFYDFDPLGILEVGKDNWKGGALMTNFNIVLGSCHKP